MNVVDVTMREKRVRIAALSSDLTGLWHAPGTTNRDRKEIIRHLVDKVVVHVEQNSEYVDITIHWQGGHTSEHQVVRPVRSYEQLRDFDKLVDRIAAFWWKYPQSDRSCKKDVRADPGSNGPLLGWSLSPYRPEC